MLLRTKLLIILLLLFPVHGAWADCYGTIKSWVSNDAMIHAAILEKNSTKIYINNIREFKAIDISFYGFNNFQAKQLENKYNCTNVSFIEFYDQYGTPQYQIGKGTVVKK